MGRLKTQHNRFLELKGFVVQTKGSSRGFFQSHMDRDKSQLKVLVEWWRRVRSWNESERAKCNDHVKWEKVLWEERGWVKGKRWLLCSCLCRQFPLLRLPQKKRNSQEEAHVRTQGGWKICIGTEK